MRKLLILIPLASAAALLSLWSAWQYQRNQVAEIAHLQQHATTVTAELYVGELIGRKFAVTQRRWGELFDCFGRDSAADPQNQVPAIKLTVTNAKGEVHTIVVYSPNGSSVPAYAELGTRTAVVNYDRLLSVLDASAKGN